MEKSSGFSAYMAIRRIVIERVIFSAKRKSSSIRGNGMIITTRIVIIPITVSISLILPGFRFDPNVSAIFLTV